MLAQQLGMSYGSARDKLRVAIMFKLVKLAGLNSCHRCGKPMESANDCTIDHKQHWLHELNSAELFSDVDNIAFSHKSCNTSARRTPAELRAKRAARALAE